MAFLLFGCAKKSFGESDTVSLQKYLSDIYSLTDGQEYAVCFAHKEEDIFFSAVSFDTDADRYENRIYQTDTKIRELKQLDCQEIWEENVRFLFINEDGSMEMITEKENCFYISTFKAEGELIRKTDITDILFSAVQSDMYLSDAVMDYEKNFYFAFNDHNNIESVLIKLTYTGEISFAQTFRGVINQIAVNGEDEVIAAYQNEENNLRFCTFSMSSGRIDTLETEFLYQGACLSMIIGIDKERIYFCTEDVLYEYDSRNQDITPMASFSEMGAGNGVVVEMVQTSDVSFELLYNEETENQEIRSLLFVLTKEEDTHNMKEQTGKQAEKKELVIAVFEDNTILSRVVKQFNKKNDEYSVKIKRYSSDIDGITLLQADIAAGNIPDILDVGSLDAASYINKGILADLSVYLDKDGDISRDDFLEQAVKVYSRDEKIYALPSMVWIGSMVAKTENLNGLTGWNLQEFQDFVNNLNDPKQAVAASTKETMFQRMIAQYSDRFIDWQTGECCFTEDDFLSLIEFCNMFLPETEKYSAEEEIQLIRENQILLFPTVMNSVMSFQTNRAIANADVTYIGYPSENGNGTQLMILGCVYAITEQCDEKEAAWEIVKALCTDENIYYEGFPAYKQQLEKAYENFSHKMYTVDENGNQIETYITQIDYGNEILDIYALTESEISCLRQLIEDAEMANTQHLEVMTILLEEARAYFCGQKSAEEAAQVMQRRVQVYLNEILQ